MGPRERVRRESTRQMRLLRCNSCLLHSDRDLISRSQQRAREPQRAARPAVCHNRPNRPLSILEVCVLQANSVTTASRRFTVTARDERGPHPSAGRVPPTRAGDRSRFPYQLRVASCCAAPALHGTTDVRFCGRAVGGTVRWCTHCTSCGRAQHYRRPVGALRNERLLRRLPAPKRAALLVRLAVAHLPRLRRRALPAAVRG
jgi:hypothetical protein